MPGIFAGIVSSIMAGVADEAHYNKDLFKIYPARNIYERSARTQAIFQFLGTAVTIGIAVVTGVLTGKWIIWYYYSY